jgi:hydroxypyruvate isomerase
MPFRLSANVDLLFTEAGDVPDRIRAAAEAGFDGVEMWTTSDRDVAAIASAARDHDVQITSILAEPRTNITFPETDIGVYYDGVAATVERAHALGCDRVAVSGGTGHVRTKRAEQLRRLADVYGEIVARTEGSGVTFMIEAFNVKVDHPGALLDNTADAASVVRMVGSDRFDLLYDLYHSIAQGEDPAVQLRDFGDVIGYLQIADVPGRGEPGSGAIDWSATLGIVAASGFEGRIGLEFYPTRPTHDAIRHILDVTRPS